MIFATIDDANNATGKIVFAFAIHARHLRGFAADQCAARRATCFGEAAQELIEYARLQFLRSDVIEKEKRPRAEDSDVVDAMIDEIGADGVVAIHGESDFQFGADAIDARDQHRFAHAGEVRRKQSAEAADLAENFGPVRLPNELLNVALQSIAEIDINACARISLFLLCHPERSEGSRDCS